MVRFFVLIVWVNMVDFCGSGVFFFGLCVFFIIVCLWMCVFIVVLWFSFIVRILIFGCVGVVVGI